MNSENVKANEKQFFEYVNSRNTEAMEQWIDKFVADDFVNHNPTLDVPKNKEGLKEMFRQLFRLFPDLNISIKEMVFENEILCFRHIISGIKGNEKTNGIAMVMYKNDKITDRWVTTEPV